jgi:hypothetical protein
LESITPGPGRYEIRNDLINKNAIQMGFGRDVKLIKFI